MQNACRLFARISELTEQNGHSLTYAPPVIVRSRDFCSIVGHPDTYPVEVALCLSSVSCCISLFRRLKATKEWSSMAICFTCD
jgi:hypothetical protein